MKQIVLLSIFICVYLHNAAQNVGIGTNTPNSSAQLDVSSSTKGFLMPRMTTAQRNAIVSPAKGLHVFNLDDLCTDIFDGINWIKNCGFKQQTDSTTLPGDFWVKKANFGGSGRFWAVSFSIGNKGYVGTGLDSNNYLKDFWEYDPVLNSWTQKADFAGVARVNAIGFSIGSLGYLGTGNDGNNNLKDFWEYNPSLNSWLQKADFGGGARSNSVGFSISSSGFVGMGYNGINYLKDFWEYNPSLNSWLQKADFGGSTSAYPYGFSIGSKGYIGDNSSFWEYNPGNVGSLGTWSPKAAPPGGAFSTSYAIAFSIESKGYIGAGSLGNQFWEYYPTNNLWTKKANIPGSIRFDGTGFSIGTKGYLGIGYRNNENFNDIWEYNPTDSKIPFYNSSAVPVYSAVNDGAWTRLGTTVYTTNESGKVGFGTSSPTNKISVIGDANFSGNIGIGITTPTTAKLVISGNAGQEGLDLSTANQYSNLRVIRNSLSTIDKDMYLGFGSGAISAIHLYSNNTETVTIKDNNVGIGNTTPVVKLHITGDEYVDGSLRIRNATTSNNFGKIEHSGAGGNFHLDTYGSGAMYLNYFSGTGVLIGNGNSGVAATFSTNGNLTIAGTLTQSSDARLKKNIEPLTSSLRNLLQLNGYTYNWVDAGKDDKQQIGIIAQEVEKMFPSLVTTNVDGYKSVNYIGLIPVMIESIKEQQKQIDELNKLVKKMLNKQ